MIVSDKWCKEALLELLKFFQQAHPKEFAKLLEDYENWKGGN